jgi:hypothetical protein
LHFFAPGAKERTIKYVPITRKIEDAEHSLTVDNKQYEKFEADLAKKMDAPAK